MVSGLDSTRFTFEGFLPRSGRDREERLAEVSASAVTVVIYEAPHRLNERSPTSAGCAGVSVGSGVSRELTKMHEETLRGTLASIDVGTPRGEYVIVLEGCPADDTPVDESVIRDLLESELARAPPDATRRPRWPRRLGVPRRTAYDLVIAMAKDSGTDDGAPGERVRPRRVQRSERSLLRSRPNADQRLVRVHARASRPSCPTDADP